MSSELKKPGILEKHEIWQFRLNKTWKNLEFETKINKNPKNFKSYYMFINEILILYLS